MNQPKVILFCPVRENAEIFRHVIDAHRKLVGVSERWYLDDHDGDGSESAAQSVLLADVDVSLAASHGFLSGVARGPRASLFLPEAVPAISIGSGYSNHNWTPGAVSRVAAIKDAAIRAFLETDADALFLIDADVIPHPDLVWHLLSVDLPIVSEVYWTKWPNMPPVYMPQVWDFHGYGFHSPENVIRLKGPGVFEVGGLGACTLIRREALARLVRWQTATTLADLTWFGPLVGLNEWGEDRHFCMRASAAGIKLYADTLYPPFHVYQDSQIEEMERWRETGSSREYFRQVWLTEEWERDVRKAMRPPVGKSVAICCPGETFGWLWNSYAFDLLSHMRDRGFKAHGFNSPSSDVAISRQSILEGIRAETSIDYLLWIDDDQLLSIDQFDRLFEQYQKLPPGSILAAWTWMDSRPEMLISAGILVDDGNDCKCIPHDQLFAAGDALIEVEWTGFPVVLMDIEAARGAGELPFLRIPAPRARFGSASEDVSFCVNAKRRAGSRIFVDPKVFVPHIKDDGTLGIDGCRTSKQEACRQAQGWLTGELAVTPLQENAVAS